MNWLQIALLILNVLRGLKKAGSKQEFLAMSSTEPLAANGDFLRLLWENREQILAFIMMIINLRNQPTPSAMTDDEDIKSQLSAAVDELAA